MTTAPLSSCIVRVAIGQKMKLDVKFPVSRQSDGKDPIRKAFLDDCIDTGCIDIIRQEGFSLLGYNTKRLFILCRLDLHKRKSPTMVHEVDFPIGFKSTKTGTGWNIILFKNR